MDFKADNRGAAIEHLCANTGDTDMAVHEATSKIVMLITMKRNMAKALEKQKANDGSDDDEENHKEGNVKGSDGPARKKTKTKSDAESQITISLSEVEEIAAQFVADRRRAVKEAVQISFVEMKKRHDVILAAGREHYANVYRLDRDTKVREEQEANRHAMHDMKELHRNEIEAMEREQDEFIEALRKKHREETDELKKKLEFAQHTHTQSLKSYMDASCDSLRMLRKYKTARIV
mmetsp:Transcript_1777/g.2291  ORF Transcript_1777/g.2291 Transcript_1777/m.2291 type:complete len:235 (-) Transcript_1777:113-817(-)